MPEQGARTAIESLVREFNDNSRNGPKKLHQSRTRFMPIEFGRDGVRGLMKADGTSQILRRKECRDFNFRKLTAKVGLMNCV